MKREFRTAFLSYLEEEKIGEGGASYVYRVKSKYNNISFALKLLKFNNSKDEKYLRFKNEFMFLINNQHDNLVKIIDSGTFDCFPFFIMPLATETLRQRIKENNSNISLKIKLIEDIITGLKFLHSKGVVHRDLKPENILIYGDIAKIADLGIAHYSEEDKIENIKTEKSNRLANFQYSAPEQKIRNNADNITTACDIYSLAIIIHELFVGEYTNGNRSKKIGDIYPEYAYFDPIIENALCENPTERIKDAIEFSERLKASKYDIKLVPHDSRGVAAHFKYDRFDRAFADIDKQYIFEDKDIIFKRLKQLLRPPYRFLDRSYTDGSISYFDVLWWTRGSLNSPIEKVKFDEEKKLVYIEGIECNIRRLIAFDSTMDYRAFVYLEIEGMPLDSEKQCDEDELNFINGKKISHSEANKGFYIDENGDTISIDHDRCETFIRRYKPWNFLILSAWHPFIKDTGKDYEIVDLMDKILSRQEEVDRLLKLSNSLPKPNFDLYYCQNAM